jgi:2-polyprenyl-6-hydroxyphenyl methylase/3-demethylubiquinone-9 3-methyltransferase
MSINQFREEVAKGQRFEFGKNWKNFLGKLNDERISNSQHSLSSMLGITSLSDKSFLDVGSGSGLSSLAAKNLGANVTSFDFDESSVWCTSELKKRYCMNDKSWVIMQGSVLDCDFLSKLGQFDIVYSWGVLHHTGKMWAAIDNCLNLVNDEGKFFIAIYNDQGIKSHFWWMVKWLYNKLPRILKKPFAFLAGFFVQFLMLLKYTVKLKPMVFLGPIFEYKQKRGMSMLSDIVDWYGGFPYDFATYDYLVDYIQSKGFELQKGKESSSHGCHELVFKRI